MFHLEYGFDQQAFRFPIVATKGERFTEDAAARLPLDMDDEIDRFSDLRFRVRFFSEWRVTGQTTDWD
jgi:hypothetical protein